jgi:hypothetical protein
VPKHHVEGDVNLGTWVQHQRTDYRKRIIDLTRTALLDAVGGWSWNTKEVRWQQGFEFLQRFVARNDHARVPNDHYEDSFPLRRWVPRQRQLHDRGELNPARDADLRTISGWIWDVDEESWETAYALLRAFVESEGHSRVPQQGLVNGVRLGTWVSNQRAAQKKGRLSPERAERLGGLAGWTWDAFDAGWEEKFAALAGYVGRTGNAAMPRDWVEDGHRLGQWIGTQRQAYRRGTLSEERRRRLGNLRGWTWNRLEEKWRRDFGTSKTS